MMAQQTAAAFATLAYDRNAPRRPVNLSLNGDLLAHARAATRNLSATVEELLAGFVHEDQVRRRAEDAQLDAVIDAMNAFHETHGFLSDAFSNL